MSSGGAERVEAAGEAEVTLRAVCAGCLLGAALAAANVYTGLKAGFLDGGSITASVLAFAWFRSAARRFSALENNLTQTIAGTAAVMSMVVGLIGPMPALAMLGYPAPAGVLIAWGLALGALGVVVALLLRPQLITTEQLPFPTGTATAEVIVALDSAAGTALRRARALVIAALVAALVGWLRDGSLALLPQAFLVPFGIWGVSAASLSIGLTVSPLLLSTGLLIGVRAAGGMLLGSLVAWALLAPLLVTRGIVAVAEHAPLSEWLMWPGAALMLSSSLTGLLLEWRSLLRGLSDLRAFTKGAPRASPSGQQSNALRGLLWLTLAAVIVVVSLAYSAFDVSPVLSLLALLLSLVLAGACARSAGETDVAPVGALGGMAQLAFGGTGVSAQLSSGAIVAGTASQTAQTLWAFKCGDRLGASLKAQIMGPLIGVGVGALVVVPVYEVVVRVYGIGTERMPAASVTSWKATAEAVQGGFSALPPYALMAALIAGCAGVLLTLLAQTRWSRFLLSPIGLGIGFLTPFSMSMTVFVGALLLALLLWRAPLWAEEHVSSLAGGAIAGESLFAVVLAALISAGVL